MRERDRERESERERARPFVCVCVFATCEDLKINELVALLLLYMCPHMLTCAYMCYGCSVSRNQLEALPSKINELVALCLLHVEWYSSSSMRTHIAVVV